MTALQTYPTPDPQHPALTTDTLPERPFHALPGPRSTTQDTLSATAFAGASHSPGEDTLRSSRHEPAEDARATVAQPIPAEADTFKSSVNETQTVIRAQRAANTTADTLSKTSEKTVANAPSGTPDGTRPNISNTLANQLSDTADTQPNTAALTPANVPASTPNGTRPNTSNTLANQLSDTQSNTSATTAANAPTGTPADTLRSALADTPVNPGALRDTDWFFVPATELPATEIRWRDASAAEVFGEASTLVRPQTLSPAREQSLTENPVFQGFVLLLAATYALLLYRNLGDIQSLLTRISRDRASGSRLTEDPGGSGFSRFLNVATTIGMLFVGVMVVKYGDLLMPGTLTELLSEGAVLALSLLSTLACMAIGLFQLVTLRLAGAVTLSQPFVSQIVLLKRTYFSLAVIVTSPVLLLYALCPRDAGGALFYIIAAELFVTAILYLRETFTLFISKKISKLHWILYLCTVEIFPISLLWLLVAR